MRFDLERLEARRLCAVDVEGAWALADGEGLVHQQTRKEIERRLPLGRSSSRRIFGTDDRRKVADTSRYPYQAVGRLEASWNDAGVESYCSGAMVSSYHFLTAAHCVYDSELGGFADEVVVSPGQNGRVSQVGRADYSLLRVDPVYRSVDGTGSASAHDLALVTLERHLLSNDSTFLYVDYESEGFLQLPVFTAGYPSDMGGRRMYEQDGVALRAKRNEIVTKLDAANGQSGSPVVDSEYDGDYFIVGVLSSQDSRFTYVTRLTSGRVKWLDRSIREDHRERYAEEIISRRRMVVAGARKEVREVWRAERDERLLFSRQEIREILGTVTGVV